MNPDDQSIEKTTDKNDKVCPGTATGNSIIKPYDNKCGTYGQSYKTCESELLFFTFSLGPFHTSAVSRIFLTISFTIKGAFLLSGVGPSYPIAHLSKIPLIKFLIPHPLAVGFPLVPSPFSYPARFTGW